MVWLASQQHVVDRKHVQRLMRQMGLVAIYPKPRLSAGNKEHKIYPYLLRNVEITRPNQVWATDITYVRLAHGFMYLVALLDWYSRYVLSWRLSNSLEVSFCVEALEEALAWQRPEIFNSDQGVQFTSRDFTSRLEDRGVAISMDGRGRVFDNIFIERLWRTVKYEDVYLHDYATCARAAARADELLPLLLLRASAPIAGKTDAVAGLPGGATEENLTKPRDFRQMFRNKLESLFSAQRAGVLLRPRETREGSRGPLASAQEWVPALSYSPPSVVLTMGSTSKIGSNLTSHHALLLVSQRCVAESGHLLR